MKKTLSIILTILMIVTAIPMAFAADETPDFSDAKVLTSVDNKLCIDGVQIEGYANTLPSGKYKLGDDITSSSTHIRNGENVIIDLNGKTWELPLGGIFGAWDRNDNSMLSIYDTSVEQTGKIIAYRTHAIEAHTLNLYGGTIESKGWYAIKINSEANLYGGKIIGKTHAIWYLPYNTTTINFYDVIVESGEGYEEIICDWVIAHNSTLDVSEYTGEPLSHRMIECEVRGKFRVFTGIKSVDEAEQYEIFCDGIGYETEYDEVNGDLYCTIMDLVITEQPSAENNYTVKTNNPYPECIWLVLNGEKWEYIENEKGATLPSPECEKTYKGNVYEKTDPTMFVFIATEVFTVEHDLLIDKKVAPTCTETGLTEGQRCSRCDDMTVEQEVIPALGHADENGDGKCDNGGEDIACPDCLRPAHGDTIIDKFVCWLVMLFNLIKSMFA